MPAAWDIRLPDAQLTSLNEGGAYPTLRSEEATGPLQLREKHPFATNTWSYTIQLTTTELGLFEYWWTNVIYQGTAWIEDWPVTRGQGRELLLARALGAYSVTFIGHDLWTLRGLMEIDEVHLSYDAPSVHLWLDSYTWNDLANWRD